MVLADRGYDADWIRTLVNVQGAWANIPSKRNRRDPICFSRLYIVRAIWWSGSSTRSSTAAGSLLATETRLTTSHSYSWHLSSYGSALYEFTT